MALTGDGMSVRCRRCARVFPARDYAEMTHALVRHPDWCKAGLWRRLTSSMLIARVTLWWPALGVLCGMLTGLIVR